MLRFFDRPDTSWRQPFGCLHFYAIPAAEAPLRHTFAATSTALSKVPGLGRLPERYLHITVQRLDSYTDDLATAEWTALVANLGLSLAEQQPFEVAFSAPSINTHAVEAVGQTSPSWTALTTTLRREVARHGLGPVLIEPPYAPHFTISYCIEDTPDSLIDQHLQLAARPSTMTVDSLALVAVDQDPSAGVFRFTTVRQWQLGQ